MLRVKIENEMKLFDEANQVTQDFKLTPLKRETKKPFLADWQNNGLSYKDIIQYGPFPNKHNIGILTGKASGEIVDVDLDGPLTVEAGRYLLPATEMVFGRDSKPASHHIYRVTEGTKTLQIKHPITGKMIVEVRSDGAQTMAPMSVHPETGETVRFEEGKSGDPFIVDRKALDDVVKQIAAVSVIGGQWIEGGRHKTALWFAGLCAFYGIALESCLTIVRTICLVCEDKEIDDRIRAVTDTYEDFKEGRPVEWRSKLTSAFGSPKVISVLSEWLDGKVPNRTVVSKTGDLRSVSITVDFNTDISTAEAFCEWVGDRLIYAEHEGRFYENRADVYDPVSSVAVKARIMVITQACDGRDQAPTVLRMVPKGVPPLRRAVSTTVRMSASPSAAHIAR